MKNLWRSTERSRALVLTVIVLLLAWEALVRAFGVRVFILPAPSKIIAGFFNAPGYLLLQSLDTLQTTLAGFVLAVIFGVAAAIGIVYSKFLDRTL